MAFIQIGNATTTVTGPAFGLMDYPVFISVYPVAGKIQMNYERSNVVVGNSSSEVQINHKFSTMTIGIKELT